MIPKKIIKASIFPLTILLVHFILTLLNLYVSYEWIDIPMHFLGGLSISISYTYLITNAKQKEKIKMPSPILFIFIISLVGLTAIFWEFAEFILDQTSSINSQMGLTDTMGDLFFGLIGGIFGFAFKKHKSL